jgi:hypothetical protein
MHKRATRRGEARRGETMRGAWMVRVESGATEEVGEGGLAKNPALSFFSDFIGVFRTRIC